MAKENEKIPEKITPCHCGAPISELVIYQSWATLRYRVVCICGVRGPISENDLDSIKKWNDFMLIGWKAAEKKYPEIEIRTVSGSKISISNSEVQA